MSYALAHDENGVPLEVPTTAVGWLVRRHSGGRGRPGAVYDPDGRPLVIALDATAADLRGHGCKSGMYRLDAVDSGRKPMGVTAFTEVATSPDDPGETTATGPDAAVAALARAVEAMQRVQAERERMQAEMFMRMVDRLAPAPVQPSHGFKEALGQMVDMQKAIRKLSDSHEPRNAAVAAEVPEEEDDDDGEEPSAILQTVELVAQQLMPLFHRWVYGKLGLSQDQIDGLTGGIAAAQQATAPRRDQAASQAASAEDEDECTTESNGASSDDEARVEAVLSQLTSRERAQVEMAMKMAPPAVVAELRAKLLALPPEAAAQLIRSMLHRAASEPAEAPAAAAEAAA